MGAASGDEGDGPVSFIDLMANDVWSEADIIRRTEAMIRSEFPAEIETILNRKIAGAMIGEYVLTEDEQADVARYKIVAQQAQIEGAAARADMALLAEVMAHEAALRRLAELDLADEERAAAQALVDAASPEVLSLYALRNPPVEAVADEALPA